MEDRDEARVILADVQVRLGLPRLRKVRLTQLQGNLASGTSSNLARLVVTLTITVFRDLEEVLHGLGLVHLASCCR